jgi:A/G-specific adenine glycosylase
VTSESSLDWHALGVWWRSHGRHGLPWRSDPAPWRVLLAETLLHRTRAGAVAALFPALADVFEDPLAVLTDPQGWSKSIRSLGLTWRSDKFLKTCRVLIERHDNTVPEERHSLKSLPGIGHYKTAAVRCFGFRHSEVLVDTNTIRVASRFRNVPLRPVEHRSLKARDLVSGLNPNGAMTDQENYALLDLAAGICTPRSPDCPNCPVRSSCRYRRARDAR